MFILMTEPVKRMKVIANAMTVDVEDYFQVSAFEPIIDRSQWDSLQHRVENNTQRILALFAQNEIKATFFTLGWVAERYPQLVKQIVEQGHELACHGYQHTRVTQQTPEQFRDDVRRAKTMLEDIAGVDVKGYRAASYSITQDNQQWAHEILADVGFQYSSSVYPVKHDLYGIPDAPRYVYQPLAGNTLKEVPITTLNIRGKNMPCGGGGFFRFYPYAFSRWALRTINQKEKQAAIFYFHPWEIDPEQPRQRNISLKTRFRHYLNLGQMQPRLERLLNDFHWDTMENIFL